MTTVEDDLAALFNAHRSADEARTPGQTVALIVGLCVAITFFFAQFM